MCILKKGDHIGIVACSNGQPLANNTKIESLLLQLKNLNLNPICSEYIYEVNSPFNGSAKDKGKAFMNLYKNHEVKAIFDISGGDLANGVLPYLDYDLIKKFNKPFFGYSDLSVVANALYTKTNQPSYLYQIRNLVGPDAVNQQQWFKATLLNDEEKSLYSVDYEWIQGDTMQGEVVGGNIRCFLKLAGTPYLPSFENKILLLESYSGDVAKMATYLNQYQQIGVFDQINGLILGTFTEMEQNRYEPDIISLVRNIIQNPNLPIVKTSQIGHGANSKCAIIGRRLILKKEG